MTDQTTTPQAPGSGRTGRPRKITRAVASRICELIANGYTLRQIERLPGMPAKRTILDAAARAPVGSDDFPHQYARAIALRYDSMAEELIEIADDGSNDWYDRETASGNVIRAQDAETAQRSKLRVDARKWLLSKLDRKRFGDRVELAGDADAPIGVAHSGSVTVTTPEALSALRERLAATARSAD